MWTEPSSQGEAKQGSNHWVDQKPSDPQTFRVKGSGEHREWRREYTQLSPGTQRTYRRE